MAVFRPCQRDENHAAIGFPRRLVETVTEAVMGRLSALLFLVAAALAPSLAAAQPFQPPPEPNELPAVVSGTIWFSAVFPLVNGHTCPSTGDCVLNGGGGIGGGIERRWPTGLTIGLEYEAWFLNSSGIYELGIMQALTAYARHLLLRDNIIHPYLGAGIGGVIFGDTLRVDTVGLAINLLSGIEWEISEDVSVVVSLVGRLVALDVFTTDADGVQRADGFGLDAFLGLRLGVAIHGDS
jgi:hypothetical protein